MVLKPRPPIDLAGVWHCQSVELGGALVLACLLPLSVAVAIQPRLAVDPTVPTFVIGSIVAIWGGFRLFRNMMAFPGIRAEHYILPSLTLTYAVVAMTLFMLRLHYSRPLLVIGFGIAVAWFHFVYWRVQRHHRPRIAVVPFGAALGLADLPGAQWVPLDPNAPHLPERCRTLAVDFNHDLPEDWQKFIVECTLSGITTLHERHLVQSLTGRVTMHRLSENWSGALNPPPAYQWAKRSIDFAVAVIALVPFCCIMLVLALIIRLDSPGPVLIRQQRVGFRGKPFRMWKLRTMIADAPPVALDQAVHFAMTVQNDRRITRVGRVLRRWRLDEVPQIFNILRGEMSWIGPRPEAMPLSRWYEQHIPFYCYRHVVRPGLSGWAQVNQGHVTTVEDVMTKLSFDFYYINRFNIWIDALIVIRTFRTMLTGFGSR